MKRTRHLSLVMIGAGSLALSACEPQQPVDTAVYETLEQCLRAPLVDAEACERDFSAARDMHQQVAPRYARAEDCIEEFGPEQCEEVPQAGGGSVFMPLMMGYMAGRLLSGGNRYAYPPQPLYRTREAGGGFGAFRTAENRVVTSAPGRVQVPPRVAAQPTVKTSTLSRGGFGSRSFAGG